MTLSIKTNRMLWGRAASRCALPECRRELVIEASLTDDPSLVGEAAHIVAESSEGPRGHSSLSVEDRNKYPNLVVLCNTHHKLIDDQAATYSVEVLKRLKHDHENWVRASLSGYDKQRQHDDEQWASIIEEWAKRADLEIWTANTSFLLAPNPSVDRNFLSRLKNLPTWILSRVWPVRHPELRLALLNFKFIANDLVRVFMKHSVADGEDGGELHTEKFYKIDEWDEARYHRLLRRYEFHVDLVQDLTCELTRAANLVADKVREHLDPSYRISEGVLLITRGPTMNLTFDTHRVEYLGTERTAQPYLGLDQFLSARADRDLAFGVGVQPS